MLEKGDTKFKCRIHYPTQRMKLIVGRFATDGLFKFMEMQAAQHVMRLLSQGVTVKYHVLHRWPS